MAMLRLEVNSQVAQKSCSPKFYQVYYTENKEVRIMYLDL